MAAQSRSTALRPPQLSYRCSRRLPRRDWIQRTAWMARAQSEGALEKVSFFLGFFTLSCFELHATARCICTGHGLSTK